MSQRTGCLTNGSGACGSQSQSQSQSRSRSRNGTVQRDAIRLAQSGCGNVTIQEAFSAANVSVTGCSIPDLIEGEQATVSATVANTNDVDASVTVQWSINGVQIASTSATVPAGGGTVSTSATITSSMLSSIGGAGTYSSQSQVTSASRV